MLTAITTEFATAFHEASGQTTSQYCGFIRFIAVMLIILAVMWCLNHFLSSEARESEGFMTRLGSRAIRLSIALMLFIIFLTT
jgi:hypothetical protein